MQTLLLDGVTWDLLVDAAGNIALASDPYSIAQDVASALKAWAGEVYYDTTLGVPYQNILGQQPPASYVKTQMIAQAKTVPEVTGAVCFLQALEDRTLGGQVQVTTAANGVISVSF